MIQGRAKSLLAVAMSVVLAVSMVTPGFAAYYEEGGGYVAALLEPDTAAQAPPAPDETPAAQDDTPPEADTNGSGTYSGEAEEPAPEKPETDQAADPSDPPAEETLTASPAAAALAQEGFYLPTPAYFPTFDLKEGTLSAWEYAVQYASPDGWISTFGDFHLEPNITVPNNITLVINSNITFGGDITVQGDLYVNPNASLTSTSTNNRITVLPASTLDNYGTINVPLIDNTGTINNFSNSEITTTDTFLSQPFSTVDNYGSFTSGGYYFINQGTFNSNGQLNITAATITNTSIISGTGSVLLGGRLIGNPPTGMGTFTMGRIIPMDISLEPGTEGDGWTFADSVFTVRDGADVTVVGNNQQPVSQRRIAVEAGAAAAITLDGASITGLGDAQSPLLLNSGASLTLNLEGGNTLTGGTLAAGVHAPEGTALVIDGGGTLTATGGVNGAGIGGSGIDSSQNGGDITIQGTGTVTANGGGHAAGIGGGLGGNGGNVTIHPGAIVYATGGLGSQQMGGGAGIGGGRASGGGSVNILGGTVIATGGGGGIPVLGDDPGGGGSGIGGGGGLFGGGNGAPADPLNITPGANVTATGGAIGFFGPQVAGLQGANLAPAAVAAAAGSRQVTLGWAAPANTPAGYEVQIGDSGWQDAAGTSHTFTGLTNGQEYTFSVRALFGTNGAPGDEVTVTATPLAAPPVITSANSASFTEGEAGSFTVAASNAPTSFTLDGDTLPEGVTFNTATGVLGGTPE
ncbi:MAG: fibronectin type III domain-containing protein, partial [Defluviitaleaceae bacterium]|nr:fibronectin type III domain-containing protein [Defluviitaleaceae bacterium]